MNLRHLLPVFLCLAVSTAYAEDDHDHDHDDHEREHEHHESNLLEQLGFGTVVVEDRNIGGREVMALPISAVFHENGKTFVIMEDEKEHEHFNRWEVYLGASDGRFVEAKSGVFPGDEVIVKLRPLLTLQAEPVTKTVAAKPQATKHSHGNFGVQIGAFSKAENAKRIADELKAGFGRTDVLHSENQGKSLYRVRVGDYESFKSAKDGEQLLKSKGFTGAFVVKYP
ncbi:MAG: SPOR domain-containing protein [Verrucomicrobiales bacterium]|nr:SPOR domain-containing protein [Verrucomicrobiales bacterium]